MWPYVFAALFLASLVFVGVFGGWAERATMAVFVVASLVTNIDIRVVRDQWIGTRWGEFWIDIAVLVALGAIAARARHRWVVWIIALQTIAAMGHLSRALQPDVLNKVYYSLTAMLAYPMLLILVAATAWRQVLLRRPNAAASLRNSWRRSTRPPPDR